MPAKKDDDKVKVEETSNPAVDAHKVPAHAEHAEPKAEKPAPKAKADPKPEPAPEPAPPQQRIEDLLKDRTFDTRGKVRTQLAEMLVNGQEFAPAALVAQGR
jgi:hypothetical protein